MLSAEDREHAWGALPDEHEWDLIVVGGGITGVAVAREAARRSLKVLLVEQRDLAWGTSSRSSKLIHGGLRYLRTGQIGLTRASVRERNRLLECAPGLIEQLGFVLPSYRGEQLGRLAYAAGLATYDLLAGRWDHRRLRPAQLLALVPEVGAKELVGGYRYSDAQTDDARLVLRVALDAVADGATLLTYTRVEQLLWEDERVVGVTLRDAESGRTADVRARAVVSATGAWADQLRGMVGQEQRMRPLRGSHLVFPGWRLPVAQALSFLHPDDGRFVFVLPWEGVTLVGTTDIDHGHDLRDEPHISPEETAYLMAAIEHIVPQLKLTLDDVVATFAGVRPVVNTGASDPSKESREHVLWDERGLLTVTGGKLTTFRLLALETLEALIEKLPELKGTLDAEANDIFATPAIAELPPVDLDAGVLRRLAGRYGTATAALLEAAQPDDLAPVAWTTTLWAELRWAARAEGVQHLDDLLLRRTRLGLMLPQGGLTEGHTQRIAAICQAELGWDDERWQAEAARYRELWRTCYSLPERSSIPDWTRGRPRNGHEYSKAG